MVGPQSLWHETDEAYLVVGASGLISDANPAACRVLGTDRVALVGSSLGEVFVVEGGFSKAAQSGPWAHRTLAEFIGPSQSVFAPNVLVARIASGAQKFCLRRLKSGRNAAHWQLYRLVPIGQTVAPANTPNAVEAWWHWRVQDRRLEVASSFFESLGYDSEISSELSREPEIFLQLMLESDRERVFKAVLTHIKQREALDVEFRAAHLVLGMRSYRIKGQAFRDQATGRVQRISGLLTDVTEAKVLDKPVSGKVGSDPSFGLSVRIGPDGCIQDINEEARKIFGLDRVSVVGTPWTTVLKDSQGSGVFPSNEILLGLRDFVYDSLSGRRIWLRGILAPLRDVFGSRVGLEFTGFDITEIKRAEALLQSEVDFRRASFDHAASIIVTTDASGMIASVNAYGLRRLGYQEHELVGQKTPSVFVGRLWAEGGEEQLHELARPMGLVPWLDALKPNEKSTREVTLVCRWGEQFPALMSMARVTMSQGASSGYILVAADLSELVRAERVKSDIVGVVSHELRTPLNNFRGALRLIKGHVTPESTSSEPLHELFGIAERSADRMNNLIRDLLDLQSVEAGPGLTQVKSVDLHEVIHAGLDSVVLLCSEKNVALHLNASETPLLVRGSFGRLVQVLTNLLANAVRFSPAGSSIEVQLAQRGTDAFISVRDFGPGVPPAFRRRLFKKFAQMEPSHSREKSGTGLGLSIAKAIVEQHSGQIGFRNLVHEGGGAEFYFTLPLEHQIEHAGTTELAKSTSATILIVEDDPDISDLVASAVEVMGFASVRAGSVAEAKEALQSQVIDAVTLDLVMPDNHGLALMEWMQAEPRSENIPVIVVSGYSSSSPAMGDAGRLRSADSSSARFGLNPSKLLGTSESFPENVIAWVEKPIRTHVLAAFLRDALEIRAQRTVAYLGPTGGRSLVFLRGVCSRLASVVVLQNLDETLQFLSCHPCSTLVVVDPDETLLEALRSRRSRFARSLVVIQWYVEIQDPKPAAARADEGSEVVDIGHQRAVDVRFLRVSGTHWAAAAFFQHWLGQGRSLVAS